MNDQKTNNKVDVTFVNNLKILFEESPQHGKENQIWCDHNPITHYIAKMMKLSLS